MLTAPGLTVTGLLNNHPESIGLILELVAGRDGLDRTITSPHVQKTGLALAGFQEYLRPGRVLLFGDSEVRYIEGLSASAREDVLAKVLIYDLPCVVIAGGLAPPPELASAANTHGVPLFTTSLATPLAMAKLTSLLDDVLAVRAIVHGVLLDILGLGVLIVGESGIGKSECALDLVVRGHRLVADDAVEVRRRGESMVIGSCPELTRNHMEIRGLGVLNIRDLFGVAATRTSKRIEFVVQLERWEQDREYERLGLDDHVHDLVGLAVPLVRMPVGPGRNLAILVEVAARNQLLRSRGFHAARELASRLNAQLAGETPSEVDDDLEPGGAA